MVARRSWLKAEARKLVPRRPRRGASALPPPLPPCLPRRPSPLQLASVRPATVASYALLWSELLLLAGCLQLPLQEDSADLLLVEWMQAAFERGDGPAVASRAMAAVKFFLPAFARGGTLGLPGAGQALKGFKLKVPPRSRLPLPWEVVALWALTLLRRQRRAAAHYLLLAFHGYLRPCELLRVRVGDVAVPDPRTRFQDWTVVLHPLEGLVPSKTLQYDETFTIDQDYFRVVLSPFLAERVAQAPPQAPLIDVPLRELQVCCREAAALAGVAELATSLYQLRHSGPTADRALQLRSLDAIKLRGRWQSDASLQRYKKEGRVAQQFLALPEDVRLAALQAPAALAAALAGPCNGLSSDDPWLSPSSSRSSPGRGSSRAPCGSAAGWPSSGTSSGGPPGTSRAPGRRARSAAGSSAGSSMPSTSARPARPSAARVTARVCGLQGVQGGPAR